MAEKEIYDYVFKFILIGNGSSGKTSLLYYFIHQKEKKAPTQTIGVEFSSKLIQQKGKNIKLQLWDTAGQERFRSITKTYYRGALGAIIVFDVTKYLSYLMLNSNDSFEALEQWIKDAKEFSKPTIQIIVVGNKIDLEDDRQENLFSRNRQISSSQANQFCQDHDALYIETSALLGQNSIQKDFGHGEYRLFYFFLQIKLGQIDSDSIKPRFLTSGQKVTNQTSENEESKSCNC